MSTQVKDAELPELITLRQLAAYLQVPASTIYLWRTPGPCPAGFLVGKRLRFRRSDVEEWLAAQAERSAR